jgi:hypothetical protein
MDILFLCFPFSILNMFLNSQQKLFQPANLPKAIRFVYDTGVLKPGLPKGARREPKTHHVFIARNPAADNRLQLTHVPRSHQHGRRISHPHVGG